MAAIKTIPMQAKSMISNIPNLESLVDIANIGVVIALALSFVFGGASIFLSRKLSRQKETQAAHERQISDENIARANEGAAKANREAIRIENEGKERVTHVEADAKQKIAGLTSEAEQAKKERAEADKQIAIAKADAAKANVRVEEEGRKRAEAERALLEVQERIKPRHLTPEQRAKLLEILKAGPKGKVTFQIFVGDKEAGDFLDEIAQVLVEAGWQTAEGAQSTESPPRGLGLYVFSAEEPPFAGFLQNALKQVGLDAQGVTKTLKL